MDAASLEAMEPMERAQVVGNYLFPHVAMLVGEALAGKITGMLLEMPPADLASLAVDCACQRADPNGPPLSCAPRHSPSCEIVVRSR